MGRRSGKTKRWVSRFFKERQIYHRSDGVVHFISMSTRTQVALAVVIGAALLWVAYASVNVVFKEQIIVAKDRDSREQRDQYEKRLEKHYRAYNDMSALNVILQEQFDEAMAEISSRHQTLKTMVEQKATVDDKIGEISRSLAGAGFPDGKKPRNANRVMIDAAPAEPTPRQSRVSALVREARKEARARLIDAPENGIATAYVDRVVDASAALYVQQIQLLASLEERAQADIDELQRVIRSTGLGVERVRPASKISNTLLAQGGPFIDASNVSTVSTDFFRHANRAMLAVDELTQLSRVVDGMPIGSPLTVSRRQTSGFGVRRDPFNGRLARHYGLDFAARWAAPVVATAPGRVKFAGVRSGFGRTVEVDHGNGFVTRYAHLNRLSVKRGQTVSMHEKVGELGNSGRSSGPHVHYEVLFKGKQRNPARFIQAGRYVFES